MWGKNKNYPTNFNEKKVTCKTQNFYILPALLLINIALLIAIGIYFYIIKHQTKHLLTFCYIKNQNKSILIVRIENECYRYKLKKPNTLLFQWYYLYRKFLIQIILKKKKKPDKNILIYYTRYETIKKDLKIYSVNPSYLIFGKVNR